MNKQPSISTRRAGILAALAFLAVISSGALAQQAPAAEQALPSVPAQQQPAAEAVPSTPANLPIAPSKVLEQQAAEARLRLSNAGSGAVYHPAGLMPAPAGAPAGVAIEQPTSGPLPLSLDDAIAYGLTRNVRLQYDESNQREVKGLTNTVFENLIPNLNFNASSAAMELNLAAMGFKPALLARFAPIFHIPPAELAGFSTIVKVDVTQAQINASQELFNLPDLILFRAAKSEAAVVDLETLNSRGNVVLAVSTAYLQVLADQANLNDAQAQLRAAKTVLDQATAKLQAGVGTHLDQLRGQVDFEQRQQAVFSAEAALQKDTIQLNRIMGLPANQDLALTDAAPFSAMEGMDLAAAEQLAFVRRKAYLQLQAEIDVANRELHAVKYQRLPTLAFNGYYGVLGETEGLYHGVFTAEGSLRFPIFRESAQRGEEQTISAQLMALRDRLASTRVDIEAQLRSAMLDVQAAHELVQVAQSNAQLAQQELDDERDRFAAGVDDDLPVIDAEASVAGAQAQLVRALYQYNVAKLNLARDTGVIESRYRAYLGR